MATVSAVDLGAAERAWRERLGYQVRDRGVVDRQLAQAWDAPRQEGRSYVLMTPASGKEVFIRLVEGEAPAAGSASPRRSLGWSALEITVEDCDALDAKLRGSELEILGEPRHLELSPEIYPMQVQGKAEEVIYLTEIRGDTPAFNLPRARSFVDHLFIVVLAAADLDPVADFYQRRLGFDRGATFEMTYRMINDAFGFPADRRHWVTTAGIGRDVCLEIDRYPEGTPPRAAAPGMLPPATAAVSFTVDELDDGPWLAAPHERREIPYDGQRMAACVGAAGELVELIEGS